VSSTAALSLKQVPEKLVVIGAGVIGVQLVNKLLIRPPGTVAPGGLCSAVVSFSFLWHFAALYLRDGWGDRPETLTYDFKCGYLDIGGLKCGGLPPRNFGGKWFRGKISEPPRPIATKLCQTM